MESKELDETFDVSSASYASPIMGGEDMSDHDMDGSFDHEVNVRFPTSPPPPPQYPPAPKSKIGSLDLERVINTYSIEAARDRCLQTTHQPSDHGSGEFALSRKENSVDEEKSFYGSFPHRYSSLHVPTKAKGYSGTAVSRWALVCCTGLFTGLIAIFIVHFTEIIVDDRSNRMDFWAARINSDPERANLPRSYRRMFALYLLYNLALALLASVLCLIWAPEAVGSGIPEVKAYLNGVRVKRFTSGTLFLVKVVATVLSVSSGLVIGPEGPLVHLGAIIGASLTKLGPALQTTLARGGGCICNDTWLCKVIMAKLLNLSHFCTDGEQRKMISVGAAAGFAAAFGAPIGGVLFSLEEASNMDGTGTSFKMLVATSIATFTLAVYRGDLSRYSVISLGTLDTPDDQIFLNRFAEIPLYMLLGVGGGLLGALFCHSWKLMTQYRQSLGERLKQKAHILYQLSWVVGVSILTSTVTFWLPFLSWACTDHYTDGDLVDVDSLEKRFNCGPGQVNELGSIFFGSREKSIKHILTNPNQFDPRTLLLVGVFFFPLMTVTLGVSLPSGIFMPTILVGCSLGGFAGLCFQEYLAEELSPSTFSLLGAAALLAGIQRSTVSLCVILVEGTGQTKVLIPVICTVVVARYVGDMFTEGLYEIAMEIRKYPYLDHHVDKSYDILTVGDIMSSPPVTLNPVESAQTIARLLRGCSHHGFPVVDNSDEDFPAKFLGLVRRDQLVALLECGVFLEEESTASIDSPSTWSLSSSGTDNMSIDKLSDKKRLDDDAFDKHSWLVGTVRCHNEQDLSRVDDSLPRTKERRLSETCGKVGSDGKLVVHLDKIHKRKKIDVAAVMNRGAYCVSETCPLSKAYEVATSLGLRQLIVLGGRGGGSVVGIVTRSNLLPHFVEERTKLENDLM